MKRNDIVLISQEEMDKQKAFTDAFKKLSDAPKTFHIVTYGCQMNVHDSERLSGILCAMGLQNVEDKEDADIVLSNTCCIRDNAERKALGNVNWLHESKKKRPNMLIGICGCMVQEQGMLQKLIKQYPFVDFAFGTANIYELPQILYQTVVDKKRVLIVKDEQSTLFEGIVPQRENAYQAYVNVIYGCNNFCSYCIVPYVRGRERSRNATEILKEVEQLVSEGAKEITFLGQNVNSYGNDREDGISFPLLLKKVEETGIERIRFMTSHPKDLSDALIEQVAQSKAIQPHFHLPVQSGNNRILEKMNRRYTREKYLEKVLKLKQSRPDIGLTTDLIVGFPGETEEEFMDTMALVETVGYDSAYTFIYSPRIGTEAAKMPNRVPLDVSTDRIMRLIALQDKKTTEIFESLVSSTQHVLVTGTSRRNDSTLTGKCGRNISVNFTGTPDMIGQIVPIRITSHGKTTLRGEILK